MSLVSTWDTLRPLNNPNKGWYHHMLDNGIGKYLIQDDSPEQEANELYQYAISKGITLSDDSPIVAWYIEKNPDTWSVNHPHFFEGVYKNRPAVFGLQYYGSVKKDGNWLGKNGEDTIPGLGVSGADIFKKYMELIHPAYIGFFGYPGEWLGDNPDLTGELLNLSGYWCFPKSIQVTTAKTDKLGFTIEWLNKGVAPACNSYMLKGKLVSDNSSFEMIEFEIKDAGNKNWMPGEVFLQNYSVQLNQNLNGNYLLFIPLYDQKSGRPVDIGLKTDNKDDDYFMLHAISF